MQYMILIYGDEKNFAMTTEDPKAKEKEFGEYMRTATTCSPRRDARRRRLKPTTARRRCASERQDSTTDGPFAETKEQLGGYYRSTCRTSTKRSRRRRRCPAADGGSIEVRPLGQGPDSGK